MPKSHIKTLNRFFRDEALKNEKNEMTGDDFLKRIVANSGEGGTYISAETVHQIKHYLDKKR